jgi:hypothetical protein
MGGTRSFGRGRKRKGGPAPKGAPAQKAATPKAEAGAGLPAFLRKPPASCPKSDQGAAPADPLNPGQALDGAIREAIESHFGHELTEVRVSRRRRPVPYSTLSDPSTGAAQPIP